MRTNYNTFYFLRGNQSDNQANTILLVLLYSDNNRFLIVTINRKN